MHALKRAQLVDKASYARERAAFWGREMIVAMRMGLEERAVVCAEIAFRFAVDSGYAREDD